MSDSLKRVVTLATLLANKQEEVKALDQKLKDEKAALRELEREDLPQLMAELGLSEIKLEDGRVVSVVEEIDCGISEERRAAAHAWLVERGFGGLIKTEVAVEFGRGDRDSAVACAQRLAKDYEGVMVQEVVHPQTLKAFVKEQMAAGNNVPFDLFGVFPYSVAKLKTKRGK